MPNPYDGPEYRRLLTAARRSLERTGGDLTGSVSVTHPDDAERKAIIGVTGQYRPEGTSRITVRLADLDAAVREATGHGLPDLLAGLGVPLRNRPAERQRLAVESAAALRSAEKSPMHSLREWFREWVSVVTWDGTMTRLVNVGEQRRVGQAVRVLEVLEARAGVPVQLAELAAEVTGDTKALNHGTTLSTLVMRALALRAGVHKPLTTEERRELWDSSGVVVDDLASRVLVLNLPSDGKGLGEWLTGAARLGMPFYVTLQQLVELEVIVRPLLVYVCENPAVLRRAAAELGAGSAPLVCTEGQPSTAFHHLAVALKRGGGELRYHGDFDWPGVAIAGSVMRRHGARPWRMSAADYIAGVRADVDYARLTGTPQPTPWDPELGEVMTATGRALYEESVADALIADLPGHGLPH
jgi:uncharacterized protein (TIGR02679 family)